MPQITVDEWIARLRAKAQAEAECARCEGRESADCGETQCRYWLWTATPEEFREVCQKLYPRLFKRKKHRGAYGRAACFKEPLQTWRGPVAEHDRWDKEEVA